MVWTTEKLIVQVEKPGSWDRSEENDQTGSSWQVNQITTPYNKQADGVQQNMIVLGFTPVSQEQESKVTVGTNLQKKTDSWRAGKKQHATVKVTKIPCLFLLFDVYIT